MTNEDRVTVSVHVGYAIATIEAFLQKPGVSGKQIREAIDGLAQAKEILSVRDDAPTDISESA
jgi:hypothetical protein